MATITVTPVNRTGVDPIAALVAASAGGDNFTNTGVEYALFKNTDAGAVTVTEVIQATVDGQAVTSRTFVVPATTGYTMVGPFPTSSYNDGNGRMNFTYSGVTALKIAVFKNATT